MTSPFDGDLGAMHRELRAKTVLELRKRIDEPCHQVAVLAGGVQTYQYDTDHEHLFRQESNFHYLFGVNEPDMFGAIEIASGISHLFIPRQTLDYEIWCGKILPPERYKQLYAIDEVHYVDELADVLKKIGANKLHYLEGVNTDSGHAIAPIVFDDIDSFQLCGDILYTSMLESRLIKTESELQLMRHLNEISSRAHVSVMQRCRPGMFEFQLESIFKSETSFHGNCRIVSYTCICGSGANGAILHYGHAGAPNSRQLTVNDMCLLDMGAEFHCYASDITCSYPASGKFTTRHREIYTIVYRALCAVQAAVKPDVEWVELHRLALRVIAESLLEFGFLRGSLAELVENHVAALFMPHGLGHLIGKDTHDPGGYPAGRERIEEPGTRNLRCNRVLQKGMVVSNEPGVYFIEALLRPALDDPVKSAFFNRAKVESHFNFGGVRLEDDIVVTESGCENLTKVPRTIEEIERVMAGGEFKF